MNCILIPAAVNAVKARWSLLSSCIRLSFKHSINNNDHNYLKPVIINVRCCFFYHFNRWLNENLLFLVAVAVAFAVAGATDIIEIDVVVTVMVLHQLS